MPTQLRGGGKSMRSHTTWRFTTIAVTMLIAALSGCVHRTPVFPASADAECKTIPARDYRDLVRDTLLKKYNTPGEIRDNIAILIDNNPFRGGGPDHVFEGWIVTRPDDAIRRSYFGTRHFEVQYDSSRGARRFFADMNGLDIAAQIYPGPADDRSAWNFGDAHLVPSMFTVSAVIPSFLGLTEPYYRTRMVVPIAFEDEGNEIKGYNQNAVDSRVRDMDLQGDGQSTGGIGPVLFDLVFNATPNKQISVRFIESETNPTSTVSFDIEGLHTGRRRDSRDRLEEYFRDAMVEPEFIEALVNVLEPAMYYAAVRAVRDIPDDDTLLSILDMPVPNPGVIEGFRGISPPDVDRGDAVDVATELEICVSAP